MEIQTLFYWLASMFMILGIIFVLWLLFMLWRLEKSALAFKKKTVENISNLIERKKFVGLISLVGLGLKWFMQRRNKETS